MQEYADKIKESLGSYKFYRNIDLVDKATALLETGDAKPIFKSQDGVIYCIENSLRITIHNGGSGANLMAKVNKARKFNFVVVYFEGDVDISEMFDGLKCNTLVTLSMDYDAIKAYRVFNNCDIGSVLISAHKFVNFGEFIRNSSIKYFSFLSNIIDTTEFSEFLFADNSRFSLVNIYELQMNEKYTCTIFRNCNIIKMCVNKPVFGEDILDVNTTVARLTVNNIHELSAYRKGTVRHLEIISEFEEDNLKHDVLAFMAEHCNSIAFAGSLFINEQVQDDTVFVMPNSMNYADEASMRDTCKLQCAVHCVKDNVCHTYINPDLKYVVLHLPPVKQAIIHGPAHILDIVVNVCGALPEIKFVDDLHKAVNNNCLIHKFNHKLVVCKAGVDASKNNVSVFSSMLSNAVSTMSSWANPKSDLSGRYYNYNSDGSTINVTSAV